MMKERLPVSWQNRFSQEKKSRRLYTANDDQDAEPYQPPSQPSQIHSHFMKTNKLLLLLPLIYLLGCYSGSVKPLLNRPEFRAENEPIRTLRILLITDDSYRKDEIERFVSKCSGLAEMQVGIRLEIVDGYQIKWEDELEDIIKMEIRIAADTWSQRTGLISPSLL